MYSRNSRFSRSANYAPPPDYSGTTFPGRTYIGKNGSAQPAQPVKSRNAALAVRPSSSGPSELFPAFPLVSRSEHEPGSGTQKRDLPGFPPFGSDPPKSSSATCKFCRKNTRPPDSPEDSGRQNARPSDFSDFSGRHKFGETVPNTGTSAALGTSYGGSGQNADPDEFRSFVPERSETHDTDSRGIVSEDVLLIAIILMLLGEGGDNYEVLLVLMILFAAGL